MISSLSIPATPQHTLVLHLRSDQTLVSFVFCSLARLSSTEKKENKNKNNRKSMPSNDDDEQQSRSQCVLWSRISHSVSLTFFVMFLSSHESIMLSRLRPLKRNRIEFHSVFARALSFSCFVWCARERMINFVIDLKINWLACAIACHAQKPNERFAFT